LDIENTATKKKKKTKTGVQISPHDLK
jgi:hypothetical protein